MGCSLSVELMGATSLCQIAADEMGMKNSDVFYRSEYDSGLIPQTPDSSICTYY